ncbi:hypothetical protein J5N97_004639 [Dioscorea zingiberensis]|uniref:non-specific serine/threonine protein kinase n=1 Tax=Dioscorea zingiberensis TaxID=325984 RepID=A0A9D5HRH1_9LILI|nr:hypothetical protein J5N97_004639 [Dioscorea zingiberensis]
MSRAAHATTPPATSPASSSRARTSPVPLPDEFFNLTSLRVIDLTRNYLNGTIPVPWASLPLTKLSLLGNRISGKIPKELGHITTLQELVLEDNMLEGTIPTSLGNLVNLEKLHLSGNYFTGELPELLANLKNLIDLRIDGNPISGKIPPFMGNWKKLNILHMQGTSMEGPFPSNFSALEALTDLMVSPLERGDGQFPPLWNMKNLKRLVLRNISLSGELPDYIGNMKKLKTLDLSFNNLTGKIPDNFSSLKKPLKFLFLTNNRLTGKIPNWILESDNRYYDLSYNSFDDASAPEECYRGYFEDSKLSTGAILGIVAAACVLIALISIFIWFCLRRKIAENNELQGLELQTGYFTLRQIKAATSNFDPANKIGEGGFGPVYKEFLPDGSVIAVKQLSSKSKQGNREFINEIGMISALHHPNLVKLFGCCIEGNQLLLVYEYMENNSLASALFGPERDRLKLDWQTRRRNLPLCIARALVYLHEESRLKIVHRDIKATNVLLDKDRNAKISDFWFG